MGEGCRYCGGKVRVRQVMRWGGKFGPYDPRTWIWTDVSDPHCGRRACRALYAYWVLGRSHTKIDWRGPAVRLYQLADFLRRMADPQTPRDCEYSKRFVHREAA